MKDKDFDITESPLAAEMRRRILLLDGAMGTMIQRYRLSEDDFRGERFIAHSVKLTGCNDLLSLSSPGVVKEIHRAYLDAGADIISTDTFNANAVSMADYGLDKYPGLMRELNCSAARIARECVDEFSDKCEGRKLFVAGSVGPTNRSSSMSPDVTDPAARNITYDQLYDAYAEQIDGLLEGGVDIILFETVFDTLNLKAGLDAANVVMRRRGQLRPIMISATVSDKAGRTLSGQTIPAFVTSVEHYGNVMSLGLNCGFGPSAIIPYLRDLSASTNHFVSCHPNAGLPNALGEYDESPEKFAHHVKRILEERLVNVIGGCCGTTPEHISFLRKILDASNPLPRVASHIPVALRVSGLEMVEVMRGGMFVNVGERCNVAGSRKFLRLIKEKNYEEAMRVAARQVADGAMLIDINMDDPLIDAMEEMVRFIRYIMSDPEIARVPIMIDSSSWEVVEGALKNLQGKSIVNSISLKEGEDDFVKKAMMIRRLGASVIVMAFDEEGQADTFERKIAICRRSYQILVERCGFLPEDIIFDVNIMAVATGMEQHARYGIDFIRAVEWVKNNLPGAGTSGGVSNLSFAFRGKNALREAMHAVFLYHAVKAGLDMAIMNPASSVTYDEIEPSLRTIIEDVVLARRPEAADGLAAYAAAESGTAEVKTVAGPLRDLTVPVAERLKFALIKGDATFLKDDLDEAVGQFGGPVAVIEGPLMAAMNHVGELFGEGKMFLPQVVRTARTMKQAVDYLQPLMQSEINGRAESKAGKVVFATVKGDVHDIGKNICSIVLECNNYEVIDLGVMVPAEKIIETVKRENPGLLCLSGLITPSLSEMVNVAKEMNAAGLTTPILVGGATTSRLHTALRIAPVYNAPVVHVSDASQNPLVAARLLNKDGSSEYIKALSEEYARLVTDYHARNRSFYPFEVIGNEGRRRQKMVSASPVPAGLAAGEPVMMDIPLDEVIPYINYKMLLHAWRVSPDSDDGKKLLNDAERLVAELADSGIFDGKAIVGVWAAHSDGDDLIVGDVRFPLLRQQRTDSEGLSPADFVSSDDDYVGVFAVTAGRVLSERATALKRGGDDYGALLCQTVADRLAEASSEWLHAKVRRQLWGYAPDEHLTPAQMLRGEYQGIRPAMGYPMLPDQLLNKSLAQLIPLNEIGIEITENGAMSPSASVSGLYMANPEAHYFMVGEIAPDQLNDYSRRRGLSPEAVKDILNYAAE